MAKFKAAISYQNCYFEEIIEIEAETISKARIICEEIKKKNEEKIIELNNKNIFTSRKIKKCELYKLDWRLGFLGCMNFENELKNDI